MGVCGSQMVEVRRKYVCAVLETGVCGSSLLHKVLAPLVHGLLDKKVTHFLNHGVRTSNNRGPRETGVS